jgi:hypothetical protein
MVILQKSSEGIVIGRNSKFPIGVFMFNSWNGTLNTVLVGKAATDNETELLRKIAYQYAEKIMKKSSGKNVRHDLFGIFQESFDEYLKNPAKELVREYFFTQESGRFIKNVYDAPQETIDEIIRQVKDASGLSISIGMSKKERIIESTVYTVSLENDSAAEFTFWNSNDWPSENGSSWNLHIVPNYHPSSPSQGKKACGLLINGATDALIRSETISSVYSPQESRQKRDGYGTSWHCMKHPYKAAGKSFQFTLRGFYHATKELVDDAVQLILASLGVHPDGIYVGISGGFDSTYDFPENIANRTGRKLPCKERPRGSEKHFMWTYDVLKEEGELDKAYIPSWFTNENWVKFFENQKGIFPKFL